MLSLTRSRLQVLLIVLFAGAQGFAAVASAEPSQPASAGDALELVLDQAPLGEVVKAIAQWTGADYIFEPPLPGRVTIAVPSRVSAAEATEILHAALLLKGFVALPIAPARFKIVRWEKMAGSAPYVEGPLSPDAERSLTTRIVLRHARPEDVARALRPLVQASGQVIAYAPAASLILAGTENRVHRLIGLARQLDSAKHEALIVRRLRYRDAREVEDQLNALLDRTVRGADSRSKVDVQLDARTNALVLSGPATDVDRLREWIELIDTPVAGSGDIHVVQLVHQDPEELSKLLREQGSSGAATSSENTQAAMNAGPLVGQDYTVVAHPPTRSLVIRSNRATFDTLRQLIAELDREPRMVRIDVKIFEISTDGVLGLGVGAVIPVIKPEDLNDAALIALVNPQILPTTIPGLGGAVPSGLGLPLLQISGEDVIIPVLDSSGQPVLGPGGVPQVVLVPGLGIGLIAQQTQAEITLVQRPSLTIAVGEESEIFVGDNIPIPVGSTNGGNTGFGPSIRINIQRQDVGILLRVKPRLSGTGGLRLDLRLENQLVRPGGDPEAGPILSSRSIETSFSAGFGKRLIIAGLNSETTSSSGIGVPGLSDIPVLGQFFSARLETKRRTYMVVSVQAHLIPTSEEKQATAEALARAVERLASDLDLPSNAKYALRAASYYKRETAEASRQELDVAPWPTLITRRESDDGERFDLFVLGLQTMYDVAKIALTLETAGLVPEIVNLAGEDPAVR